MRKKHMLIGAVGIVVGVLLSSVAVVLAGNLDSPAGPTESAAQMYTLEQIYDRLNDGTAATKQTTFQEPASAPGSTMHTLDEIMAKAPAADNTDGAGLRDVQAGKTYWGLTSGNWGLQTGKGTGVPVTGQTGCWNSDGSSIDCAGTGQDGEYQLGHLPAVDPRDLDRFTDNGDGTVTDNLTRLVWLKNADCAEEPKVWDTALSYSNALYDGCTDCFGTSGDCGLSDGSSAGDWRLPNVNELHSLVMDSGQTDPALPPVHPFSDVGWGLYWSSTSAHNTGKAWFVDLSDGDVNDVGDKDGWGLWVWPVRGGQ